jgi:hypothetical protein
MADYRTISVGFWNDPYTETLSPVDKLFYIYLFSCPHVNNAGILHVSPRKMAYETGIDDVQAVIDKLIENKKLVVVDGYYWVVNFIEHQASNSPMIVRSIGKALKGCPSSLIDRVLIRYQPLNIPYQASEKPKEYPTDRVSIPSPDPIDTVSILYQDPKDTVCIPSAKLELELELKRELEGEAQPISEAPALRLVENVDNSQENVDNSRSFNPPPSFNPPTLELVVTFFLNRKQPREIAERFFWNYEKKGWVSSKDTPILNWHAAAQSWMAEEKERQSRGKGGPAKKTPGSFAHDPRYRLFTPSEIDKTQMWNEVSLVRLEGLSACKSAQGKVLFALNADIDEFNLIRREPKQVGQDWPD